MADGKVRIQVEDNAKQSASNFQKLDRELKDVSSSAKKADGSFLTLKNALIGVGGALAFREVARFGGALVQAASDAEETANKFNVVFQDVREEATRTADEIAESYGLSSRASQQFLSDTGDLLTGLGFTGEQALATSDAVTRLAVDLASFTNVEGGAERASAALTSALLGEREAVKSLGIAIGEADIKQLAEDKGIVGELTRQQKAVLTLELAIKQSKNAIGDFERSQDSLANSQRKLSAEVEDLSKTLGGLFTPTVTDATQALTGFVSGIDDFVSGTFTLDGKIKATEKIISELKEEIESGDVGFLDGIIGASAEQRLDAFTDQLVKLRLERDALLFEQSQGVSADSSGVATQGAREATIAQEEFKQAVQEANKELEKTSQVAKTGTDDVTSVVKGSFESLSDGLATALTTPFESGKSAAQQFGQVALNIIQQVAQELLAKQLLGLFTSVISPPTGGSGVTANAKGNAFQNGKVQAFADGGVVNRPTFFPMSDGGTGLMGEAGAEAIMPLRRTKDGRLGVEAQGNSTTINVINNSASQIETVKRPDNQYDIIVREVTSVLASERSDGAFGSALARQRQSGVQGA